jgi:hypothetical protein
MSRKSQTLNCQGGLPIDVFPIFVLTLLLGAMPVIAFPGAPLLPALVAAAAAAALLVVVWTLRLREAGIVVNLIRPFAVVAAVPIAAILVQNLPANIFGLSHPIWESAETALGYRLYDAMSVDPGASLLALCDYLSMLAILFVAVAIAIDRQRAKWTLLALMSVTTMIALVTICRHFAGSFLFGNGDLSGTRDAALDSAALGVILSVAMAIGILEWQATPGLRSAARVLPPGLGLAVSVAAFVTCLFALMLLGDGEITFTVAFGLATLIAELAVRRLGLGGWGYVAAAATAITIGISFFVFQPAIRATDLTLVFATQAPPSLISITQRMLADGTWTGSGAGTFAALLPIYRDAEDYIAGPSAPSAAAAIVVEFGRPALWLAMIVVTATIGALLRGALRRGRDSFYSAAGAGCLVTITLLSFHDSGLFTVTVSVIVAAILGLGIAQMRSQPIP